MVCFNSSEELLRRASQAAGTSDVREAVRDLTLHALCSRPLTAIHIAIVTRTVGEGIESASLKPSTSTRESKRMAWAGLEDAVGKALHAVEILAREIADERQSAAIAEREELLADVARMERTLGEEWERWRALPEALRMRIGSATTLLRKAATIEAPAFAPDDSVPGSGSTLPLVASGVLLGLAESFHDNGTRESPQTTASL